MRNKLDIEELFDLDHSLLSNEKLWLFNGCNYHTKWQKDKSMRFVLGGVHANGVILFTRTTNNLFWAKKKDLIYINSKYNNEKAKEFWSNVK